MRAKITPAGTTVSHTAPTQISSHTSQRCLH